MTTTTSTSGGRDWLAIVRALLTKAADDTIPQAEADALTEKATRLMAKYAIDAALITKPGHEQQRVIRRLFEIPDPYASASQSLLAGIAGAVGCRAISLASRHLDGARLDVFGYAADIERAELLYTSLLLQMHAGARHWQAPYPGYRHTRSARRGWMLGFIEVVVTRIEQVEQRVRQEAAEPVSGPSKAVVLADRGLQVQAAFQDAYPRVRQVRSSYNAAAAGAGRAAGAAANIGGTGVAANGRRALS